MTELDNAARLARATPIDYAPRTPQPPANPPAITTAHPIALVDISRLRPWSIIRIGFYFGLGNALLAGLTFALFFGTPIAIAAIAAVIYRLTH